jgi:hypothetical protein
VPSPAPGRLRLAALDLVLSAAAGGVGLFFAVAPASESLWLGVAVAFGVALLVLRGLRGPRRRLGVLVAPDPLELFGRASLGQRLALRLVPYLGAVGWAVLLWPLTSQVEVPGGEDGGVLLGFAAATVLHPALERAVARRVAASLEAESAALADRLAERLGGPVAQVGGAPAPDAPPRAPDAAPEVIGLRWGRGVAILLGFTALTLVGIALVLAGEVPGLVLGAPLALCGGWIALAQLRILLHGRALTFGPLGLDPYGWGPVPWGAVLAAEVGRADGRRDLLLHLDGDDGWMTARHRRAAKRHAGDVLTVPLLLADAAPDDVVAALRAHLPELPVLVA